MKNQKYIDEYVQQFIEKCNRNMIQPKAFNFSSWLHATTKGIAHSFTPEEMRYMKMLIGA